MRSRPSRRAILRGLGATLALPWLESVPATSAAHETRRAWGAAGADESTPLRLVYVYVPNGVHVPAWRPGPPVGGVGRPGDIGPAPVLRIFDRHCADLRLLTGLTLDKARANGDGPGDHARSAAAFLTATQPRKSEIEIGASADQFAARSLGQVTRFASLQLGCEPPRRSGQCDSGYPCAYSSHLSWSGPHTPLKHEVNPRSLFDRLFGDGLERFGPEERARWERRRRSVLDFVAADARALSRRASARDRRKLEEYLEGLRALERRLASAALTPASAELARPEGVPADHAEHVRLQYELLALALHTDATRVGTFMVANEGSNRVHRDLGCDDGHHTLSHHGGVATKREQIERIDRYYLELFGEFLDLLDRFESDGGTRLLDGCMVLYGSGIADGNRHDHHDLPLLLAGGRAALPTGARFDFPAETPLANLHLTLLERMGVSVASMGDSTGVLF